MTTSLTKHFTADDLDAFHTEALSSEMRIHLETCEDCRRLAVLDREVLTMMSGLRTYGPRDGFSDRVMARVTVATPAPVPVLSFPKLTRRRIAALSALAAGMVASVAWSFAYRSVLDGWLDGAGAALWTSGTALWAQSLAAIASVPWLTSLQEAMASPGRLVVGLIVVTGGYAAGLMALRRLVNSSAGAASNA